MADCPERSLSVNSLLMRLFAKKYFGEFVKKKVFDERHINALKVSEAFSSHIHLIFL